MKLPPMTRILSVLFLALFLGAILLTSGCGSARSVTDQRVYASTEFSKDTIAEDTTALATQPEKKPEPKPVSVKPTNAPDPNTTPDSDAQSTKARSRNGTETKDSSVTDSSTSDLRELLDLFSGGVDNSDSASAVDDEIWRLFDLAEEYHGMGMIANREASWEEAQYYFEKCLKILATLDIDENDTLMTPESVKYSTILDNVVSDYRITLRSLGKLQQDVAPSVLVERFGTLERKLGADVVTIAKGEFEPVTYDLPVVMNDRVRKSIVYFQTTAHDAFVKYLSRSKLYTAMFKEILAEHNMPLDLVYLSLVESGYNPSAYSWARAMGLWQFISSTGRMYGLNRNWWLDERKDPIKATHAAARFLKDLYEKYGDWELAMAAYNGGPGRVSRTIRRQGTRDFWKLRLKRQTMDYIPLIYAAAIIAKNQEKYGFTDIKFEDPVVWEEIKIDRCLDLKVVAKKIGCSLAELKRLNPELLRNYTPPNVKSYTLKLPVGKKPRFIAEYDNMKSPKETSWVKHKIRRGETVSTIAARYGVSQYAIFNANNLSRRSKIYAGKQIIVPVPMDRDYSASRKKNRTYEADGSIYGVRAGDTMWDIARAFGTSVSALRRINYIERGSRIYVGQKLKIPSNATMLARKNSKSTKAGQRTFASGSSQSPSGGTNPTISAPKSSTYKVRPGDTLWDIARMFGTTTAKLRRLNGLGRSSRIYPGQSLSVTGGSRDYVTYSVRRGDTLGKIARKHRTTVAKILALNGLIDPNNIGIGDKLRIQTR